MNHLVTLATDRTSAGGSHGKLISYTATGTVSLPRNAASGHLTKLYQHMRRGVTLSNTDIIRLSTRLEPRNRSSSGLGGEVDGRNSS